MKNWFKVFFLFFVLGLLVYSNGLNNKFLIDDYVCLSNPVLSQTKYIFAQWDPYLEQSLGVSDSEGTFGYYRPMAHMVSNFEYDTFKDHYWSYHLLNIFLFVLASSLVYLFITTVIGNSHLALLAGLFYLIHPVNQLAVDYILGNAFSLEVVFMLGTILLLWYSLERKKDRTLYSLSLLFSFLSLFWHESGSMAPFYIGAVIILLRKEPLKEKAFYLLPFFLISFSYLVFRLNFLGLNEHILEKVKLYHMTPWEYLSSLFQVYSWYTSRLFFPQGIVMQWATPLLHGHIMGYVMGMLALMVLFLVLFVKFAKEKLCQMGLAWLLIGFGPVCLGAFRLPANGVQIEPQWFVFSSIGFFILAACFCLFVLDRMRKIGATLLFIIIFAWGSFSYAYTQVWTDQKTYALYWSQQVPYLKSTYFFIAEAYQQEGDLKEAITYYRLALAGDSSDLEIYNNLGVMEGQEGDWKAAELNLRKVLKINPHTASAYSNLGMIYSKQGQWGIAQENYNRALTINPFLMDARRGLATVFLNRAEYQKAASLCLKALDIVNNDPETLLLLGNIFIQEKDFTSLKEYAYRIIDSSADPHVLMTLGIILAQHNAPTIARDCFKKAHYSPR